jgi:hypothetical protein
MTNVFKSAVKPLLALGLLSSPVYAQLQSQVGGPKFAQPMIATSLLTADQQATLSYDEANEATNITVYQDAKSPGMYYYIPPVVVSQWKENRYSLNIEVQERITKALLELADSDLEVMTQLAAKVSSGDVLDSAGADNIKAMLAQIDAVDQAKMNLFVTAMNKLKALLPQPYSDLTISNSEEALALASAAISKIPSTRAQVSLAFGFTQSRADTFNKLKKLRPDIQFNAISAVSDYVFTPNNGQTSSASTPANAAEKLAQQEYESRKKMINTLFQPIFGLRVGTSGTVVGMDLNYGLVRGWRYSKDNPYLGTGEMFFEGGDFVTTFPISARFDGRVKCQFNAEVVKQKIFSVEQMPETVLMVETSTDIDFQDRKTVSCELFDKNDKLISSDGLIQTGNIDASLIPPGSTVDSYATGLNSHIQDKITKFTEENTTLYTAARDLSETIYNQAQSELNGWLNYPVPMLTLTRKKWESSPECRDVPRQGGCIRHGWKKGHGIKKLGDEWVCKEYETLYDKQCADVQKLVYESYQKPAKVRGFSKPVAFERRFDVKKTYEISSQTTATVSVKAKNDACFARKEISNPTPNKPANFTACDGNSQKDAENRATDNVPGETATPTPPTNPTVVFY